MAITGAQLATASASATITSGMAAGAIAGGIMGNGSLKSIVAGATTGMLFGAVGASGISGASKVLASGTVGGITTDARGGQFEEGFKMSGITSSMSWGYETMVGYKADPLPGKSNPNHTTYDSEVYPAGPQGMDVSGFNEPGKCFLCQGGIGDRTINALPGGQAVSHLDDFFNNTANVKLPGMVGDTLWFKGVTIPAAVVIAFPALLDGPMAVNLSVGRQ